MTNRGRPGLYEFFAGGGLAGRGLSGFETLFANDLDPAKAASWRANHPDIGARMHMGDVWALSPADLPGRAALAWASSPCQDLSLAGARRGLEARRSGAFWGFWRLMQGLAAESRAPRLIVVENVMGLATSGGGRDFETVCRAMADAGYRVGALEIDAAPWLPQSRPRLFIIAAEAGLEAGLNAPTPDGPFHSPRIRAAHDRLPDDIKTRWLWWRLKSPPGRNTDLSALLEPDDAVDWLDDEAAARLVDLMAPLHRQRLAAMMRTGERRIGAGYRRVRTGDGGKRQRFEVRFDGLAGCLRTPAGGSSRQFVVVCEDGHVRVRRLTGRESARLMGLPDSYVLPKSEIAALKLMGDAVAVPVVRALSEQILVPALKGRDQRAA